MARRGLSTHGNRRLMASKTGGGARAPEPPPPSWPPGRKGPNAAAGGGGGGGGSLPKAGDGWLGVAGLEAVRHCIRLSSHCVFTAFP